MGKMNELAQDLERTSNILSEVILQEARDLAWSRHGSDATDEQIFGLVEKICYTLIRQTR